VGILGTYEDITERQIAQEKIRYQAMHDLLTGLPNRTQFNEQLSLSLTQARLSQIPLAVMFLDLDRFKTINDTLGHAVGDRLLQEVADRLTSSLSAFPPTQGIVDIFYLPVGEAMNSPF
jgi:GGDEF domain-containing protein